MSAVFTAEFINEQIVSLKAQLVANATARAKAQESQSYSLDTGQTRISAFRAQLATLGNERASILNELRYWENQLCGTGTIVGRPGW